MSLNELGQKLTCTMLMNFNALKRHITFESKKIKLLGKTAVTMASKKSKSSCEVPNKTYRFWDSYKITHGDIEATVTRCNLSPRFFSTVDVTLLCKFESDKI